MVPHRKSRVAPPPANCPLTICLKLIEGAWTGNVIWYLRAGPRRFTELKGDLRGISAKTLAARLRRLGRDGIVSRQQMPTSPPTVEYGLTAMGMRLIPAVEAIALVGSELKKMNGAAADRVGLQEPVGTGERAATAARR